MNIIPIQNVWFDDAATSAMGEAFDRPANRFEISDCCTCLRSSRIGSLQPPKMASAIPPASMSKH